jgi:eukaryotic-like serine/threonine-protein kinase
MNPVAWFLARFSCPPSLHSGGCQPLVPFPVQAFSRACRFFRGEAMSQPTTDRNLLFGILALQMDFLRRDDLIAAMHAWVLDKDRPLGQILCDQRVLSVERRTLLDALVQEHLKQHGNDSQRSLVAANAVRCVGPDLQEIADDEVQASLSSLGPPLDLERTTRHDPSSQRDGSRYRRLRPHARGGLGEVFVAEDTELHREVALKEIQPERADDPLSRGRFVLEAEITGALEHPGIVPVYGLGVYPDGRPYYAMRFIRGGSFKEAIDSFHAAEKPDRDPGERSLALRQLLRRFIDVCNAVAYAHSRGVLHRDLKPANVMLGKFGETLVVDWGLAKAGFEPPSSEDMAHEVTIEPALFPSSGSDLLATQTGAVLGTPAFMSPEQAAGRLNELGTASDIFSLGSTLYVLLTGKKPFDGTDRGEIVARVQRGQFSPPRLVKSGTPSALDAICCKAMALRPGDRYPTALDLAADVEHWLADEPVAAYPEPWTVRAARWARRHRTAVVSAAVFLVSAVIALTVSTALIWREQQNTAAQQRVAEQNFELARDLSFNGITLIESSEVHFASVPALHSARKDLLKATARAFQQYLEQKPADPELRERAAQVFRYTANVHSLTNETATAESLFVDALQLQEGLVERHPEDEVRREKLALLRRDYAHLQAMTGRLQEAANNLDRARTIVEELQEDNGDRIGYRLIRASVLLDFAGLEHSFGRVSESEKTAKQAAQLFRGLLLHPAQGASIVGFVNSPVGQGPVLAAFAAVKGGTGLPEPPAGQSTPYTPLLLASALNRVAVAERESGRFDIARAIHNEAIKPLDEMKARSSVAVNPADVLNFLARCRLEQSRTWAKTPERRGNAEINAGAAALQWEGLAKNYPGIPLYREWLGAAYQFRGQLRAEAERLDEARADFEKSRQVLVELVKDYPQLPYNRGNLGRTYAGLARLARRAGNEAAAAEWFAKAADALRQTVEQSPDDANERRSLEEVRAEQAK